MKKNIITLVAISLSLSGCGIYTKYEPATVVPDDLYGGEVVTEDTAGLGNMDWRELFTDPYLQSLIEVGLQTNTDYQSAQLRVEEAQAVLMSAKLAFLPAFALAPDVPDLASIIIDFGSINPSFTIGYIDKMLHVV